MCPLVGDVISLEWRSELHRCYVPMDVKIFVGFGTVYEGKFEKVLIKLSDIVWFHPNFFHKSHHTLCQNQPIFHIHRNLTFVEPLSTFSATDRSFFIVIVRACVRTSNTVTNYVSWDSICWRIIWILHNDGNRRGMADEKGEISGRASGYSE